MISATLTATIRITDPSADLLRTMVAENTWPNPAYQEAVRMKRSVYGLDRDIVAYQHTSDGLILPRGYLSDLLALVPECPLDDQRKDVLAVFPPFQAKLRGYQEAAVEKLLCDQDGIVEAPTGAGKTLIGLAALSILGRRALVLVHANELAQQWRRVIKAFFDTEPGMIGGGKWQEGTIFTIATLQTLHRNLERAQQTAEGYGAVLVDECHHVPASTFAEVLSYLPVKFRYGLSATPHRRDGLDVLIHRVLGPTRAVVTKASVEATGGTVPAIVRVIETGFDPGLVNGWGEFVDALTLDENRNRLVMATAERAAARYPVLVLVDRVRHAEALAALATMPCVLVHGSLPPKERIAAMALIPHSRLTIGTLGLLGEGLDVGAWTALVLGAPISSRTRLLQAIGRVVRAHSGKTRGYVADLVDSCAFAKASFRKRDIVYQECGITLA